MQDMFEVSDCRALQIVMCSHVVSRYMLGWGLVYREALGIKAAHCTRPLGQFGALLPATCRVAWQGLSVTRNLFALRCYTAVPAQDM